MSYVFEYKNYWEFNKVISRINYGPWYLIKNQDYKVSLPYSREHNSLSYQIEFISERGLKIQTILLLEKS